MSSSLSPAWSSTIQRLLAPVFPTPVSCDKRPAFSNDSSTAEVKALGTPKVPRSYPFPASTFWRASLAKHVVNDLRLFSIHPRPELSDLAQQDRCEGGRREHPLLSPDTIHSSKGTFELQRRRFIRMNEMGIGHSSNRAVVLRARDVTSADMGLGRDALEVKVLVPSFEAAYLVAGIVWVVALI
ncbi:hypothetical protein K435DRAFT_963846 [Dendrothele bispora CBS 962.96]|uniref:Uncharacterized protein n=1 Tax=Dendrothele bispora (strain CBS 962.96) TaxID=1314807 RepID=A0A4S8MEG6_DENBC|nr:hypothetical protein K435DRAFT_963846 [Dendrothele bispora CBS 962.96]